MQSLELKIPPPVIAALVAIAMWGISLMTPLLEMFTPYCVFVAIAIALIGIAFNISGIISFRQARTTVNPMKPESASSLVSSGIYRVTRNPMYVGFLFVLIAWAAFLSSPWALLGPLAFFLYISRFQIAPEERVLSRLFGTDYSAYKAKVRQWL
ncbi:MAG: isoprenylcysteine carboxylmethyltransferase family protein [Aphanocapsa sp. GSE-SYN-MK-11-07L]|jgi:protein-S-isoprenylcysteine O-methyltransferase Ste14|nr:isoprenylcysteine carboxylmethyltransferase family protein [Aphanocapsa sp. GSE-SYN-MK-11-07L]